MPRECARGKRAFLLLMRAMLLPVDRASCPRREHVPSRGRTRAGTELRRAADAPSQHAWAEQTDRSKTQRALLRVPWQQSGALAITYAGWMLAGCWCSGCCYSKTAELASVAETRIATAEIHADEETTAAAWPGERAGAPSRRACEGQSTPYMP